MPFMDPSPSLRKELGSPLGFAFPKATHWRMISSRCKEVCMSCRSGLVMPFAIAALSVVPAIAQDLSRSEVSLQYFGSFVSSTFSRGVHQSATDSGGLLANYRYFFNDYNGIELNYGASRNTQKYQQNPFQPISVLANNHEGTAAYVVRYPGHRVVPFALAGVGGLVFDPRAKLSSPTFQGNSIPVSVQARAAFVYGAGLDINLTSGFFLRSQYRGLVYSSPDFNSFFLGPDRVTHRAEPSFGVGFRF